MGVIDILDKIKNEVVGPAIKRGTEVTGIYPRGYTQLVDEGRRLRPSGIGNWASGMVSPNNVSRAFSMANRPESSVWHYSDMNNDGSYNIVQRNGLNYYNPNGPNMVPDNPRTYYMKKLPQNGVLPIYLAK